MVAIEVYSLHYLLPRCPVYRCVVYLKMISSPIGCIRIPRLHNITDRLHLNKGGDFLLDFYGFKQKQCDFPRLACFQGCIYCYDKLLSYNLSQYVLSSLRGLKYYCLPAWVWNFKFHLKLGCFKFKFKLYIVQVCHLLKFDLKLSNI